MELAQLLGETQMLDGIKKALGECNSLIVEELQQQPQEQREKEEVDEQPSAEATTA